MVVWGMTVPRVMSFGSPQCTDAGDQQPQSHKKHQRGADDLKPVLHAIQRKCLSEEHDAEREQKNDYRVREGDRQSQQQGVARSPSDTNQVRSHDGLAVSRFEGMRKAENESRRQIEPSEGSHEESLPKVKRSPKIAADGRLSNHQPLGMRKSCRRGQVYAKVPGGLAIRAIVTNLFRQED